MRGDDLQEALPRKQAYDNLLKVLLLLDRFRVFCQLSVKHLQPWSQP
jgi:hypothetical protein